MKKYFFEIHLKEWPCNKVIEIEHAGWFKTVAYERAISLLPGGFDHWKVDRENTGDLDKARLIRYRSEDGKTAYGMLVKLVNGNYQRIPDFDEEDRLPQKGGFTVFGCGEPVKYTDNRDDAREMARFIIDAITKPKGYCRPAIF